MGLTSIPTETDGSLGRTKEDISAVPSLEHCVPAAEHNTIKLAIAEMAEAVGLEDGTTAESLEMLKRAINDPSGARPDDFVVIDDFINLVDWVDSSSGGGAVSIADGNDSVAQGSGLGLLLLEATTSSDSARISDEAEYINGAHNPVVRARIRTHADLDDATFRIGIADVVSVTDVALIATNGSSNGWNCYVSSSDGGSSDSDSDAGSDVQPSTWYDIRIEVDGGSEARFYVNDTLIATLNGSGAVPNAADLLGRYIRLTYSANSGGSVYVDYYDLRISRL